MPYHHGQMHLGNIMRLSHARTRSISAENVYGEKGCAGMAEVGVMQPDAIRIGHPCDPDIGRPARELGQGWKVRPYINLPAGSTMTLMDVDGPGIIQHMWFTCGEPFLRDLILRMYWDDERTPSVEVPLGDFFCNGWKRRTNIAALPINVNPSGGFNCYFPMPFRQHARITIENRSLGLCGGLFYTINYALTDVGPEDAYFHAQFRRVGRLPDRTDYTILDGVAGRGHYVGTYLAWQQSCSGWWGEGEIKFFLDGDRTFPTICGTGTEDYFGGAWGFGENYSAPFLGYPSGSCDGAAGNRHSLYRFHILDPIRFERDLRVTIQALGWQSDYRFLHLQDDIASVAYWYQSEPHIRFPALPDRSLLDVAKADKSSPYLRVWDAAKPPAGPTNLPTIAHPDDGLTWQRLLAGPSGALALDAAPAGPDGSVFLTTEVELDIPGIWTAVIGYACCVRMFVDALPMFTDTELREGPLQILDRSRVKIRLDRGRHRFTIACSASDTQGVSLRLECPIASRQIGAEPAYRCVSAAAPDYDGPSDGRILGRFSLHGPVQAIAVDGTMPDLHGTIGLPDGLARGAIQLHMDDEGIDLESLIGCSVKAAARIFAEFTLAEDGPVTIGLSADWWLDAFIDGLPVFTTGKEGCGHGTDFGRLREHLLHVDLPRGRHSLALHVVRGQDSARLRIAGPDDLRRRRG